MGRERELGELEVGLGDAFSGRGKLFLVGGEPGIGKSRLAEELASRARDRGAQVLWGQCWEAGGAPAYWPWVQAIRTYLRDQDARALLSPLGSGAADIAQMIPEIHDLVPDLQPRLSSDPEGERAAALLAYEEGARLFRLALQVLEMRRPPDVEARCRVLLALGDAQARGGDLEHAKETFLRAAGLARDGNMFEQLAAAALGYGGRFVWSRAGSDRHLVPLLDEALRSLPEGDSAIRARLMSRLVGARRDDASRESQDRLSQDAVDMARRIGDSATISYALEGRFAATWWPENPDERLATATEILRIAREADDMERIAEGHDWRVCALMELGDIAGVDVELEAIQTIVEELRQPAQRWLLLVARTMRALIDGRFDEAERLITDALGLGQRATQRSDAVPGFRIHTYLLRREQGRLAEVEADIKRSVSEYPTLSVFRCMLAHLHVALGRPVESHRAFDGLAVNDFAGLRRDNYWLFEMTLLAEVADFLGDARRAAILYSLLSPFAGRSVSVGGDASTGSASRGLGLLASVLQRWDQATGHFEEALERNAAMGARPWVAHTQHDFARMLLRRDGVGDRERAEELLTNALETCRELGMPALAGKVTTLQEEQGILGPPHGRAPTAPSLPTRGANTFRREGEYWSVRFDRDAFRLRDSKGLRYLAHLLGSPAREFLALDLMTAAIGSGPERAAPRVRAERREPDLRPSSGRSGEILDATAKDAYRRRLEELQDELEEAERWGDSDRAARARGEQGFVARELAAAVGLGGRDRRAPSDAERARVNVTKAIKAAIAKIGKHSPALAQHLANTVRTGTFCSYVPDPRLPPTWQV